MLPGNLNELCAPHAVHAARAGQRWQPTDASRDSLEAGNISSSAGCGALRQHFHHHSPMMSAAAVEHGGRARLASWAGIEPAKKSVRSSGATAP